MGNNSHDPHIDKTDFTLCDLSTPTGCLRCKPKELTRELCCDLCHPEAPSADTMNNITNVRPTRIASRLKSTEATDTTRNLRTALLAWREQAAIEKHGKMVVRQFGSIILMSDRILDRLVACAEARKISTIGCIRRETQWRVDLTEKYGTAIIAVLHAHFPLSDPPSMVGTSASPDTGHDNVGHGAVAVAAKKLRKPRTKGRCSACGSPDHIRTYYLVSSEMILIFLNRFKSIMPSTTCGYSLHCRSNLPPLLAFSSLFSSSNCPSTPCLYIYGHHTYSPYIDTFPQHSTFSIFATTSVSTPSTWYIV